MQITKLKKFKIVPTFWRCSGKSNTVGSALERNRTVWPVLSKYSGKKCCEQIFAVFDGFHWLPSLFTLLTFTVHFSSLAGLLWGKLYTYKTWIKFNRIKWVYDIMKEWKSII